MYPQTVAERKIAQILERKYQSYEIEPTNDMPYTLNKPKQYRLEYRPIKYPVYAYNGEKYIRVVGVNANDDSILSNWKKVKNGQPYWGQSRTDRMVVGQKWLVGFAYVDYIGC